MNEKVKAVLAQYDQRLGVINAKEVEDRSPEGDWARLGHCRWMIGQMNAEAHLWSDRKVNRWLGFIQGVLWSSDIYGIKDLRDQSRHFYDD